jgi:hypothetical protein
LPIPMVGCGCFARTFMLPSVGEMICQVIDEITSILIELNFW